MNPIETTKALIQEGPVLGDYSARLLEGKKRDNQLTFQDKELVEVLFDFTRARERCPPLQFWQQNLEVVDNTFDLFTATGKFLKIHYEVVLGE